MLYDIFVPENFYDDDNTIFAAVNRDNGDADNLSDWFEICDLAGLRASSIAQVAFFIDESGVFCVTSQFGEVEDMNFVRDEETRKSKGFTFVKHRVPRSCVLAVDNFSGTIHSNSPAKKNMTEK